MTSANLISGQADMNNGLMRLTQAVSVQRRKDHQLGKALHKHGDDNDGDSTPIILEAPAVD